MPEHIFITFLTGSQNNKLNIILAKFIHYIGNQVKPLLVCQTGNDADKHCPRIFVQPEISLKLKLVFDFFLAEGLCIIILCNVFICLRIEYIIINSVDNTAKVMGTCTEKSIQPFSVKRCLDLFCIGRAYGCNRIRIYQTAF